MLQALVILATAGAAMAQNRCDPSYQCKYHYETSTDLYYWDFTSLCRNTGWYYFEKGNPDWGNFYFNICGTSPQLCNPQGETPVYKYGVAVQLNSAAAPTGNCPANGNLPCTADCEIIGIGQPYYEPRVPSNPLTGGINITHTGVPEFDSDKYKCSYVPGIGTYRGRAINYIMDCDPNENGLVVTKSTEDPQCTYNLFIRSKYACGRIYDGPDSKAGQDKESQAAASVGGESFGYVVLGSVLFGLGFIGVHYYQHRELPFSIPGVGNLGRSATAARATGAYAGFSS